MGRTGCMQVPSWTWEYPSNENAPVLCAAASPPAPPVAMTPVEVQQHIVGFRPRAGGLIAWIWRHVFDRHKDLLSPSVPVILCECKGPHMRSRSSVQAD